MEQPAQPISLNGYSVIPATHILALLLVATAMSAAHSQTMPQERQAPVIEEQRRRAQAEAAERLRQLQVPHVDLQQPATLTETTGPLTLPTESPCYRMHHFVLDVPAHLNPALQAAGASKLPLDPFRFAQDYLSQYAGRCIGPQGINLIMQGLDRQLLLKGYSTTRIGIGVQELASGTVHLTLLPGTIGAIRYADPTLYGTPRNAFPTGPGALLTLHDLEQGLEQLKRVPSQEVDMSIVHTDDAGVSDIVLDARRSTPWKLTSTLDDSGATDTGKYQAGVNFSIDNPLGLSDMFNVGINTDVDRKGDARGTSGHNLYYAIPVGYWNGALSASNYAYHQKIAGNNEDLISSGTSQNLEFKVLRLFQRNPAQKNSVQFKLGKRWSRAFINGVETAVHYRNTSFVELGWVHQHYLGKAQLDMTLATRWGTPLLGGMPNPAGRPADYATFMYTLQSLDATLFAPFQVASLAVTYTGTLRAQHTRSPLYTTDQFSMGGRYTVRGFDGAYTLTAERGFYLRNELAVSVAGTAQSLYGGIDFGKVYGPSVRHLVGDTLAGAVIGVRGGYKGLTYDVFSGWPLYKPHAFTTATPAVGFSLTFQL